MGFCPKCKYEYEDDIKVCSDCGCELVETIEKKKEIVDMMDSYQLDTESKMETLLIADTEEEANSIIALLDFNGVKSYRSSIGAGSYMTLVQGFSTEGIRIWVLESDLNVARIIVGKNQSKDEFETVIKEAKDNKEHEVNKDISFYEAEREHRHKRRKRTQIVLFIFFGLPVLIILGLNLIETLMKL